MSINKRFLGPGRKNSGLDKNGKRTGQDLMAKEKAPRYSHDIASTHPVPHLTD